MGTRTQADRPLVLLVVVLLGLAGALVTAAGPAEFGEPRLSALTDGDRRTTADDTDEVVGAAEPEPEVEQGLPGWLLVVAWSVALLGVALLAARLLRRATPAPAPRPPPVETGDAAGAPLAVLGELRRAASVAAEGLRGASGGGVADAVVLAWEGLERAAARAGTERPPAATPTEFTVDLLRRHGCDPDATEALLTLYHRARFSSAPLSADAAGHAAAAYEAVVASLTPALIGPVATGPSRG